MARNSKTQNLPTQGFMCVNWWRGRTTAEDNVRILTVCVDLIQNLCSRCSFIALEPGIREQRSTGYSPSPTCGGVLKTRQKIKLQTFYLQGNYKEQNNLVSSYTSQFQSEFYIHGHHDFSELSTVDQNDCTVQHTYSNRKKPTRIWCTSCN